MPNQTFEEDIKKAEEENTLFAINKLAQVTFVVLILLTFAFSFYTKFQNHFGIIMKPLFDIVQIGKFCPKLFEHFQKLVWTNKRAILKFKITLLQNFIHILGFKPFKYFERRTMQSKLDKEPPTILRKY